MSDFSESSREGANHPDTKSSCTTPGESRGILERRASVERLVAWRSRQRAGQSADPRLSPSLQNAVAQRVSGTQLLNHGVDVVPIGFPAGTRIESLANYPQIVRAFSRTFGPNLFEELMLSDPFPSGDLYWGNFFFQISPNTSPPLMRLNVQNSQGKQECAGANATYQPGGVITIFDCTPEDDVFHEIGHAVMDDGILKGRAPLYFSYFAGGAVPAGGPLPLVDAKVWLNTWFGKKNLDSGSDSDGIQIGFASDRATLNQNEDFAETFKYYVYYSADLFDRVFRQSANGSNTLSMKAALIAELYTGMSFKDWGVPADWPGYRL